MKLTKRQREILEGLADNDSLKDLVLEYRQAWFGASRTSTQMINFLLRHALVSEKETTPGVYHYSINEWGRRVLTHPEFDPLSELYRLTREQRETGVIDEKEQGQPWPRSEA